MFILLIWTLTNDRNDMIKLEIKSLGIAEKSENITKEQVNNLRIQKDLLFKFEGDDTISVETEHIKAISVFTLTGKVIYMENREMLDNLRIINFDLQIEIGAYLKVLIV